MLDLRGYGDSEWSRMMDYSLEAHAGDVHAFVTELGLSAPVVVGMSLGGGTAVRYSGEEFATLCGAVASASNADLPALSRQCRHL